MNKKNIKWSDLHIKRSDREEKNKHKTALLWLTGLPSSGKSTLANELQNCLFKQDVQVFVLDGDNVRHGLNGDLGFSAKDRKENIRRIGEVAKLFTDAGFIVITAFISPYKEDRNHVRELLGGKDFIEIYINANAAVCEERDVKGLYKKAKDGEIKDFTGVSAPYEPPENPEVIIDTEKLSVDESANLVIEYLQKNDYI